MRRGRSGCRRGRRGGAARGRLLAREFGVRTSEGASGAGAPVARGAVEVVPPTRARRRGARGRTSTILRRSLRPRRRSPRTAQRRPPARRLPARNAATNARAARRLTGTTESGAGANRRPTRSSSERRELGRELRPVGRRAAARSRRAPRSAQSTGSPASVASIASSVAAISGSIGSWSSSGIAGLPELLHRAVQQGAGVRLADPEHAGQLGVGHPGVEFQRDDLPLAGGQLRERGLDRGAAQRDLGTVAGVLLGERPRGRSRASRPAGAGEARRAPRCERYRTATRAPRRGGDRTSAGAGRPARTRAR